MSPAPSPSQPLSRFPIVACLMCLVLLALLGALWLHLKSRPTMLPAAQAIARGVFADGSVVEIVRAEVAVKMPYEASRIGIKLVHGHSNTFAWVPFELNVAKHNGGLASAWMARQDGHPMLQLLIRQTEANGQPMENSQFYGQGLNESIGIKRDGDFFSGTQGNLGAVPTTRWEVEDGSGGWLPMTGPILPSLKDAHGFAAATYYPRRRPELQIRISREGQPAVILKVPTPGYLESFPTIPSAQVHKLPTELKGSEFALQLKGLQIHHSVVWSLDAEVIGNAEQPYRSAFGYQLEVIDITGNSYMWPYTRFLPSEEQCLLRSTVERNLDAYSYLTTDVEIIGEGTWPLAPGAALKITPNGQALGIFRIVVDSAAVTSFSEPMPTGGIGLVFDFKAKVPKAVWSGRWLPLVKPLMPVVKLFHEGDERSNGYSKAKELVYSDGKADMEASGQMEWQGVMKPGAFHIGLPRPKPPEILDCWINLRAEVAKGKR